MIAPPRVFTFYITGGTLPADASSYVERAADKDLLSSLLAGEYCYVLNSRQMGKSSLSVRTIARLRQSGVRTAFVDLTRVGAQNVSAEQWYAGLLAETGRALGLRSEFLANWKEHHALPPVQRYFSAIREVALEIPDLANEGGISPLVIFVDEIDAVRSLAFSADEFFAAVRACYNTRTEDPAFKRLTFCLVGSATPADLISDTRMSPFNIGRRIELRDFTAEEAAPLAKGLGENGAALIARILYWTNGHPYLTQRLCRACVESAASDTGDVDRKCRELFLAHSALDSDDNLSFVRNRLLRSEVDLASLLEVYRRVRAGKRVADDETNPLCGILKLSGAVRQERGLLQVRNRIYDHVFDRAWVAAHMPDAELQRQRAAYRKGMVRAASISAAILSLVLVLAVYGEGQRRLAVTRNVEMRRNLYVAEMNQAQQARDSGNIDLAHDLLDRQIPRQKEQEDLREFAWQYLSNATRGEERLQLQGHRGTVYTIAYSPDGKTLATAGYDKTVRLWDAASGRQIAVVKGHGSAVVAAVFSRDGMRLASVDSGATEANRTLGELKIWNVQNPSTPVQAANVEWLGGSPGSLAFSPDGKLVSGTRMGWGGFCDLVTGRAYAWAKGQRELTPHSSSAVSPDGRLLALCGGTFVPGVTSVLVYRVPDRAALADAEPPTVKTIDTQKGTVFCVGFSPDSKVLACGSEDHTVQLWDTATWKHLSTIENNEGVRSLAFSPDGKRLATGGIDGVLKFWDLASLRQTARLQGHRKRITSVVFSPDGNSVATSSDDGTGRIWNATAHRDATSLAAHNGPVRSLSFSSKGNLLATTSSTTVKIWQGRRLVRMLKIPDGPFPFTSATFSPDGRQLAATNAGDIVTLWDAATWRESLPRLPHEHTPLCVAYSPDGHALAAGSFGGTAKLWDTTSRRELHTLMLPDKVSGVAFSGDGRLLAACSADGVVQVWDAGNGRPAANLAGHEGPVHALAFSPDGRMLATGSDDGTVRLWNSGDWMKKPDVLQARLGNVVHLAFSPDGKTMVTAHGREALTVWNVQLRSEVAFLRSDEFELLQVAFSPDGQTLAAGTATGKVKFWNLPSNSTDRAAIAGDFRAANRSTEAAENTRNELERQAYLAKLNLEQGGTARATAATANGVTKVDVTSVDGTDFHVQLHTIREGMRNGDACTIRFKAKADHPRPISLNAQVVGGDWHSIGLATDVALTKEWKIYEYRFRAKKVGVQNRVPALVLGRETGTVWIGDFTVTTTHSGTAAKLADRGKRR